MSDRNFFWIGVYEPKFKENIGTLWRHANLFNANALFTVGEKSYKYQNTDTSKATRHLPLLAFSSYAQFLDSLPLNSQLIHIELDEGAKPIEAVNWRRYPNPIILLGSEGKGLPKEVLNYQPNVPRYYISTPGDFSMNVATAGTIIMHERYRSTV